ncbi:MAG: adenylate/guanylate cyclase domain-containing protein, partial [Acidobacteriota bacterium]
MQEKPRTLYARSGDVRIAYQVIGDGPIDLVLMPGWVSHLEWSWEEPGLARMLRRLSSFSRLVLFDKRGTGLSDRVPNSQLPDLEERMDDVRAVMDAVDIESAALFGVSEGGPLSLLFAATYPRRTTALIAYGSYSRWIREDDHPWAPPVEYHHKAMELFDRNWGKPLGLELFAPTLAEDNRFREWWATFLRLGASPSAAIGLYRMNLEVDVRQILHSISSPTLLLHRVDDQLIRIESSRYMAEHIPGARLVALPGADHLVWVGDQDALVGEVQEFLTGVREQPDPDRVLTTVLFVDVVGSTKLAAKIGDRAWRDLQEGFLSRGEKEIQRFRGRLLDSAGDGFLASFDGPARAIRCARSVRAAASELGLRVRSGVHTGEAEVLGDKLSGIAIHVGARVAAAAGPD